MKKEIKNNETELKINKKEIATLSNLANITITDNTTLSTATEYLSRLNSKLDEITEDKEKLTKPLNATLKAIRDKYKPVETILQQTISDIRSKMSAYATKLANQRIIDEAKITARMEKGMLGIEKAVEKLESLESVPEKVETNSGTLNFRPVQKLKIVDDQLIPRNYLLPDEALILQELKDGVVVPGCEIEIIQVPINRR